MKPHRLAFAALALAVVSAPATALDFTMDFDEIPPAFPYGGDFDPDFGSAVLGYYDADSGPSPVFPRIGNEAWNTVFSANSLAVCSKQGGEDCRGQFATAHSGLSAVVAVRTTGVRFDVSPGLFVSKLSLWYNAGGSGSAPGVELFAGATSVFSASLTECSVPGSDGFCGWTQYPVPDDKLAGVLVTRVALLGTLNKVVFDDVSVTTSPIPEPSTYALMLGGLALLAGIARRRAR